MRVKCTNRAFVLRFIELGNFKEHEHHPAAMQKRLRFTQNDVELSRAGYTGRRD